MISGKRSKSFTEGLYGAGGKVSQVSLNIGRYSNIDSTGLKSIPETNYIRRTPHYIGNGNITSNGHVKEKSLSFNGYDLKRNPEAPRASLLKYEVKKWKDTTSDTRDTYKRSQQRFIESLPKSEPLNAKHVYTINSKFDKFERKEKSIMPTEKCVYCEEYKKTIKGLEQELAHERDDADAKLLELEEQLEQALNMRDDSEKTVKKLQKQIKKTEKQIDEESVQTQRLGIKLEDANYEINRLRNEVYKLQLENEKIIEENEDLAVDNEDLIKDRDEMAQLYDDMIRECEKLKHEVQIWKTVYEMNKDSLPNDVQETEAENEAEEEMEEEEVAVIHIEEDQSLLLPPRDDIVMKTTDPSKAFDIIEEIGRGKFGKVYKAMEKFTGDLYAAKYVKVTSKLRQDVLNTIEIMKKVHHIRLMNLFDVYDLGSQLVIIVEYVGGRMLFERIVDNHSLTEAECVYYMKQVLQGLHHLHVQNICHLDIKPENIVCVDSASMDIKIIDFGLAKQLERKKDIKITAGSPEFVAPEILSFDPVSLASDMWSVGVFTYVLLSGVSPFLGDDNNDTLLNVSCGEYEFNEESFGMISDMAKDFIDMLLVSQPKKRGTTSDCLNHAWLKVNPDLKNVDIKLDKMKTFLKKRKEQGNVSAVRAIRRFSSFGVGHGALKTPPIGNLRSPSPSKHLLVPNALQSSVIAEDEEEEEQENNCNDEISISVNTPAVTITRDDSIKSNATERCRTSSALEVDIPEDTSTPDGLRLYLQRMISEGHLPGRGGPPDMNVESSEDER